MGKIYSIADRVAVYLGEVDPAQSQGVHETVQLVANHIRRTREEEGFDETSMTGYYRLRIPSEYTSITAQEILRRLYAMPWFTRIWCIQEIVLAKDAIMLWGEHGLSWADVGLVATWLTEIVPQRALEADNARYMYKLQRTQRDDFFELLDYYCGFEATHPRDRVYGLLTLVEAKEAQALCVDYDKCVGEVYADTVVAAIQIHSDLTPLKYVNHGIDYRHSDEHFTSWTSKWHDKEGLRPLPSEGSPLSACRNILVTSVDASTINSKRLCLERIYYSEVTKVHVVMDLDSLENMTKHPFLDNFFAVLGQEVADTDETLDMACMLARTLTAGCNSALHDIINRKHGRGGRILL